VSDVEIYPEKGREYIKIRHDYSDENAVFKLIKLFSNLFEAGWHKFGITSVSGLISFDFSLRDTPDKYSVKVSPDLDF
jgi:hypothetical protein